MANVFKRKRERDGPRSRDYYGKVRLDAYHHKQVRLYRDKQASQGVLDRLQTAYDRKQSGYPLRQEDRKNIDARLLRAVGLIDGEQDNDYTRNVEQYVKGLRAAARNDKYCKNVEATLLRIGKACGWKRLGDISASSLTTYIQDRLDDDTAPRTVNNDVTTAKGFAQYVADTLESSNALARIKPVDVAKRKRQRRALTPGEVDKLLASGSKYEMVYRVGLATGLRRRELRELQWQDVKLDAKLPHLALRVESTKAKRSDRVPLRSDVADRLRAARPTDARPTDRVFVSVPNHERWLADLKKAGVKYRTADDRIAGFHSLRVTLGSELTRANISPATIMAVMRHRSYQQTLNSYTDPAVLQTHDAVNQIRIGHQERHQPQATTCGPVSPNASPNRRESRPDMPVSHPSRPPRVGLEPTT